MKITLQRISCSKTATVGGLFIYGMPICHTLEDAVRAPGVKIPGETAIAAGLYRLAWNFSNRFQREMIQVLDVPLFSGIRIHGGNTVANTEGCVLVGDLANGEAISQCKGALSRVEGLVHGAILDKQEVFLDVLNPAGWQP